MVLWMRLVERKMRMKPRINLEGQNNSGWKEPQEVAGPVFCSKQGQREGQTRLLKALSSWVLKTFKDEKCTVSLSNLFQCLTDILSDSPPPPPELLLFQLIPIVSCPPIVRHCKEWACLLITSLQVLVGCD